MNITKQSAIPLSLFSVGVVTLVALSGCAAGKSAQMTFDSPEKAVQALGEVAASGDQKKVQEIFGPDAKDVLSSGDDVADAQGRQETSENIQQKVAFDDVDAKTKVAVLGNEAWPFPIPLVKDGGGWRFDTVAGREEVASRRVGANELLTIATLHAFVDAQREYFKGRHDGHTKTYAAKVVSTAGKHDGLYWPTPADELDSPLGPLVAEATSEGYTPGNAEPKPYHGYFYRLLTAQGASAPGGAKSYLDAKGALTKGFAMVAWPAKHGNSGVMTFLVDHQGIVYQKDLGSDAGQAAITSFDPDDSWAPTGD